MPTSAARTPLHPVPHTGHLPGPLGRRHWCLGAAAWLGLASCATRPPAPPKPAADADALVPFSATPRNGGLPIGWQEQQMRPDLPRTRYQLAERDGRRVLHAVADASTSGLRCDVDIDPQQRPWLHWDWRVDNPPLDATVADDALDDSPARVLVAFDGDQALLSLRDRLFQDQVELFTGWVLPFATLMYVWDGQARPETVLRYPRSSRIRYLVVESGASRAGRWTSYRRNLVDDYRRVFGAQPGRLRSVGVATDSDDLKSHSEAWYGDLHLDSG